MADKELVIRMRAKDEISRATKGMGRAFKTLGKTSARAFSAMRRAGTSVGKVLTGLKSKLFNLKTLFVGAFAGAAIKAFTTLETGMAQVSTLVDTSKVSMGELTQGIKDLSVASGEGFGALTSGLFDTISAGVKASDAMKFLETATKLAIGGGTTTDQAIKGIVSLMGSYGLEADKATEITDTLFVAMKGGVTTIEQMAAHIGKVAGVASTAGVQMDEMSAAVAVLTKSLSTTQAVTALRATISSLLKPIPEATEAAKDLGIEWNSSKLKADGLIGTLNQLNRVGIKPTIEQKIALTGTVEAFNAAMTLTRNNASAFTSILEDMKDKAGATDEAYGKMAKTLQEKLNSAWQALKVAIVDVVSVFGDDLKRAADNFKNWVSNNTETITQFAGLVRSSFKVIGVYFSDLFSDNGRNMKALKRFFVQVGPLVIREGLSIMVDALKLGGEVAGTAFSLALSNEVKKGWNDAVDDLVRVGLGTGGWVAKKLGFDPGDLIKLEIKDVDQVISDFKENVESASASTGASLATMAEKINEAFGVLQSGSTIEAQAALAELEAQFHLLKLAMEDTTEAAKDFGGQLDFNKNLQPASDSPFTLGFNSPQSVEKVKEQGKKVGEVFADGFVEETIEVIQGPNGFVEGFKFAAEDIKAIFTDLANVGARFADDLHASLADSFFNQAKKGLKDFGEFFKNTFASILDGILRQITDFMSAQAVSGFSSLLGNIFSSGPVGSLLPGASGPVLPAGLGGTGPATSIGNPFSSTVSSSASAGGATFIINAVDANSVANLLTQNNGTIANNLVAALSTDNALRGNLKGALG